MKKNAYLLVSDLHYAENKAHRISYMSEVLEVLQNVLEIKDKYVADGYSVNLVFMGDVIDTSISNPEEAMRCIDVMRFFISQFNKAYSVLGNHEQTYISNNPFWYLVSRLDDPSLQAIPKALQPKSIYSCLDIPNTVVDGNTTLYFNHYGIMPKIPETSQIDGVVAIGLFHQNVGSNDICKMWGTFDDVEQASYIQPYNYCFFGHMHLAYGKYYLNEQNTCVGEWLGSCCRTNVTEVEEAPLEFNIPAILVEDGCFKSVEENKVKRRDASSCIDYTRLQLTKNSEQKLLAIQKAIPRNIQGTSLLDSVRKAAELANLGFLLDYLDGSYEHLMCLYKEGLQQAAGNSFSGQENKSGEDTDFEDVSEDNINY